MPTQLALIDEIGGAEILLVGFVATLYLAIAAIPAALAYAVLARVPAVYRKQTPGLSFLLMIPFFSLIWAFFVHPKVAESLQAYFASTGDSSVGDCGASIALWLCICSVCSIIPLVGLFAGFAGLVLLIIFYVKAFDLSSRIPRPA